MKSSHAYDFEGMLPKFHEHTEFDKLFVLIETPFDRVGKTLKVSSDSLGALGII
jgi:hypothetical protein